MKYSTRLSKLACAATIIGAIAAASPAKSEPSATVATTSVAPSDDPIAHYRAYEAAIAAGDLTSASAAAVAAWRTGERVWSGGNANLPGLAFNAAWSLGLVNKIGEAREPAQRAIALARQYPGHVDLKEAGFILAYANMAVQPTKQNVEAFNTAAAAVDNGGWGDFLLARSYADGARNALNVAMPRVARELVDRGLAEITRLAPNNAGLKTNLLVLRTQSSLQLRQFGRAVNQVMEARRSYGRPRGERDLNWASLMAWEAAARAVHLSVYGDSSQPEIGSRMLREDRMETWTKEDLKAVSRDIPGCTIDEYKRLGSRGPAGINFPRGELNDGYAGGALVRAQLDGDGRVIGTDILASLPRASFGTAAVEGIRTWRYELPPTTPVQCQSVDVMLVFAFAR